MGVSVNKSGEPVDGEASVDGAGSIDSAGSADGVDVVDE